ncbi:unnamed protein product [Durusdinium trenchii]|uniref:Tetratricopeptide repeat-containing protein n=2 Tax=Durusdinium trenchii TaxID=1381693 RepID=A0ABP0QG72_9DINO
MAEAAALPADAHLVINVDKALQITSAEEAQKQGEAWLKAAVQSGDHSLRCFGLCKVAEALCLQKDFAAATEKVKAARGIAEEQSLEEALAVVKLQTARICAQPGGNSNQALDMAEDALQSFQRLQLFRGEATCHLALGDMYASLHEKDEALRRHKQALAFFRRVGDTSAIGVLQRRIAQDHLATPARPGAAITAAQKAVAAYQATKETAQEASSWIVLAEAQGHGKDASAAKESIGKARDLFFALQDPASEAKAMEVLVEINLRNDLPVEAVTAAKEVVSIFRQAGDQRGEALALLSVARLLLDLDPSSAKRLTNVAHDMMKGLRMEEVKECERLQAECEHGEAVSKVQHAIYKHRDFLHVPRVLIVDPGGRQKLQQDFEDFAKAV